MSKILKANKVKMQVHIQIDIDCKICGKHFMSSTEKKVSISAYSELQPNIPRAKCPQCDSRYIYNGNSGFDIQLKKDGTKIK